MLSVADNTSHSRFHGGNFSHNVSLIIDSQQENYSAINTALPYLLILLSIATTASNIVIIAAFLVNRHLRTPFNCYLISLIVSDIGQSAFDLPFMVASLFQPVWIFGRTACNFNLYVKWVFAGVVRNTHALISLNRFCALFWPIIYKQYHTKTTAIWLCIGTWVYVHIWLMPGMVPDARGLRKDDGTCFVNTTAQPVWAMATQWCLYNSTLVVITITYPFIWWKIRMRQKLVTPVGQVRTGQRHGSLKMNTVYQGPSCANPSSTGNDLKLTLTDEDGGEGEDIAEPPDKYSPTHKPSVPIEHAAVHPKRSQSFAVLTYLVLGVIFCWTPIMTFFTLADFMDYDSHLHFVIGSLLYYLNSLLDPFFFCIAIKPLRMTVLAILQGRTKRTK
ncbi:melanopsin-like [Paramacrobiotus metropolitanus]|uniref:melanopsin-like n=1 Tax=Paramacrobiotus metropolitanus TaxID=2943436 RepID=UPI002445D10C|nr:melanopsin-like [Paramacrobiotus metropolitanus]